MLHRARNEVCRSRRRRQAGHTDPPRRAPWQLLLLCRVLCGGAGLLLALALTACAGSGGSGSEFSIDGGETLADPSSSVGFALDGDDITTTAPTLTVTSGEEVTITFENTHGQYSRTSGLHDLAVVPQLDDIATLAATRQLADEVLWGAATAQIPPGETDVVTFVPDVPGTYYYLCTVPGHADGGMLGELVVESAA